ncbi:MAG: helix-turn-helix protein [Herbinix sp.]|jgi:transcriptional regulator with XRE-family HTH domain|nr:helix-turn-helix protein [Herbinix sp.]
MYDIFDQLLQRYNVTAYKVGKETGIASSTFTDWKNGKSSPKNEKLKLIADFFGVSVDYLSGNTNKVFCRDCGSWFNPLDSEDEKNHLRIHEKWEKAVVKFGFCWNYIRSDEMQLMYRKRLKDKNLPSDKAMHYLEELMKAEYSDLLRENDFNYYYDFNTFVSKQLWKHSVRDLVSQEVFKLLEDKYGINYDNDPTTTSIESTVEEEKTRYYINDETAKIAQEVFENGDLRLLFDASRNASPEDIRFAVEMLTRMKKKENFDD